MTQCYLNFLNFLKLGCHTSPYTPGHYVVPGGNVVRRLNEKTAREKRKNGVVLAPRIEHSLYKRELLICTSCNFLENSQIEVNVFLLFPKSC